jgi:phage terminase large subunit-like protein
MRQFENRFVTSETSFIDMAWWNACVDANCAPLVTNHSLPVWLGIDASVKRDSTCIVAVTWDDKLGKVRLVNHRIFQPSANEPLDFEATIETTVREWRSRFAVRRVLYDPYQMASTAQRLQSSGVPMKEFPQSVPNLTAIGSNLYELIKGGNIIAYPDANIQRSIAHSIAKETSRGFQITKEKSSHKIDFTIALAMAAYECVQHAHVEELPLVAPILFDAATGATISGPGRGPERWRPYLIAPERSYGLPFPTRDRWSPYW